MKNPFLLTAILLSLCIFFSCQDDEDANPTAQWVKMEVPRPGTIHSMYGSLSSEFLAGTSNEIQKTVDGGANWTIVKDEFVSGEFRVNQDSIFALSPFDDYYSLDDGDTWSLYANDYLPQFNNVVSTSTGILYKYEDPGTFPKEPDTVYKSTDNGTTWVDVFPFQHYIYSIHVDEFDRVYLGIIGWEWDAASGSFDSSTTGDAIIYYIDN